MKRYFFIFLSFFCAAAFGATTVPIQLLSPSGSSSGQAIVSTGASSAPSWVTVANAGTNTNITSLTGLTTPLGTWAGGLGANNSSANGVPIFSSGSATVTAVTGSGSPVLGTSPTIATPNITGVTNGGNAATGSVGEFVTNTATAVSMSSGTAANVVSVSLTAGDWDVTGLVEFIASAGATATGYTVGLSSTSLTFQTITGTFKNTAQIVATFPTGIDASVAAPKTRFSLSSATTIYLIGSVGFSGGTVTTNGFISARRVR